MYSWVTISSYQYILCSSYGVYGDDDFDSDDFNIIFKKLKAQSTGK